VRAIFLDRDGVICENRPDHVKSWNEFRFLPGVLSSLAQLANTDFATVVITNQAIINRGIVPAEAVSDIHAHMLSAVRRSGGRIDRVMVCPHRANERCACRKPQPGLLLQSASEMGIDLSRSYLVGDAASDVQAGLAVGCRCFMVLTGRGMKQSAAAVTKTQAEFRFARDLQHAVEIILHLEASRTDRPASPAFTPLARPVAIPALPGRAA
jgi:D-glycero-D-manno-heptose 1,7-bisphosphate phosphatase